MDADYVAHSLQVAETSEWFDWMRREIVQGGTNLPGEETSTLFAAKALHLASRLRHTYRHLPASFDALFVKSAIIYQCWDWQKGIQQKAKWPGAQGRRTLRSVEAVRYSRPVDRNHHLVEANDGLQYVVSVPLPHGFCNNSLPATEILCNELARMMGLRVANAVAVLLRPKVLSVPELCHNGNKRVSEVCCGFEYLATNHLSGSEGRAPNRRQLIGTLVFDVWVLNLSPRKFMWVLNPETGRFEPRLADYSQCFTGADWCDFRHATFDSLPAPQRIAASIRSWQQLVPWLLRAEELDLNPLWELAFQLPSEWYGGMRSNLASVLEKLSSRKWDLRRAMHHFSDVAYLPNLKLQTKAPKNDPGTELEPSVSLTA